MQQMETDSRIPSERQPKVWLLYLSKNDPRVIYLPVPPHQTFRLCMPADFSNPKAPLHVELGGNAVGFRPYKSTGDPNCAWVSYVENTGSAPLMLSVDHNDGWPHERLMIVSDQNAVHSRSALIRGFAGWRPQVAAQQQPSIAHEAPQQLAQPLQQPVAPAPQPSPLSSPWLTFSTLTLVALTLAAFFWVSSPTFAAKAEESVFKGVNYG